MILKIPNETLLIITRYLVLGDIRQKKKDKDSLLGDYKIISRNTLFMFNNNMVLLFAKKNQVHAMISLADRAFLVSKPSFLG